MALCDLGHHATQEENVDIDDIVEKVSDAFDSDNVDESISLLLEAFWDTTETADELASFIREIGQEFAELDGAAIFCQELASSVKAQKGAEDTLTLKWFVAEIIRITGWVTVPSPNTFATGYLVRQEFRREIAGVLLRACVQRAAREERSRRRWSIARKAGLIAAAIPTAGTSLLFLALEDD